MVDPYRPSRDWREGYAEGYSAGLDEGGAIARAALLQRFAQPGTRKGQVRKTARRAYRGPNRWNKYVGTKRNQVRYKSGSKKGKLNLGAMATNYRRIHKIKKPRRSR